MSAVFAAISNGIDSLNDERSVDIYGIAKGLRKDRAGAIQHFDQYKFVYQVEMLIINFKRLFLLAFQRVSILLNILAQGLATFSEQSPDAQNVKFARPKHKTLKYNLI